MGSIRGLPNFNHTHQCPILCS
ncbi:hypothetical protein RDI58_022004 [Solanum bulbocastanum]|uniref:Uncharacterized protein n=1 Tax=Solanum bulbocastanum TaxID=147425 RepID=A0AAN8T3C1_SOLBU